MFILQGVQGCIVQGVLCVFYKMSSVYCTRCAVCIVHSVDQKKSSFNKENFDIKSNINQGLFCHDQVSSGKIWIFFLFVTQFTHVFRHHGA